MIPVLGKCGKTTRVALRKALECLTCHPRVRLLARATLSRAIVDSFANSWESDARCAFVLQSSLQTFDAKLCSFSNNFAGNVFSEPRSIETLSAALSQESTITLERVARGTNLIHAWIINEAFESVARGKSLMHAWITNEALGTVSQRDSWLFAAIPEHKSQNSHYNEMCLHPVHWKISWMKQNALLKEFPSLFRFLTERQQSRPLSRIRSTLNTQDIFNDKTQTVTCSDVFRATLSPYFSMEYILK